MSGKYLTIAEVADYLRFSRGNIYLKVKRGFFPSDVLKRIGGSYRFDLNRLNEWLDKNGERSKTDKSGGDAAR